jgi:hypothetical protein
LLIPPIEISTTLKTASGCVHVAGGIIGPNTTKVFTLAAIAALRQEN